MGEEARGLIEDCDDGFELLPQPSDCVDDEAATSLSPPPIYTQLVCNTPQVGLAAPPTYTDSAWELPPVDYPFDAEICASELERYLDFTTPLSDSGPSYIRTEPCSSQRNPFSTQSVPLPSFKDSFLTKACPSLAEVCPPTPQTGPSLCHQDPHTIRTSLSPTLSRFFPSQTAPFSSDQSGPSHIQVCPFPTQAGISLIQSVSSPHHTGPCLTQAVSNIYQLDPLTTEAGPSHTSPRPSHIQDGTSRPSHTQAGSSHILVGCLHSKNIASPSYIQTGPCPTQEGPLSTFTDSFPNEPGPSHAGVCPPPSQTSPSLIQPGPFLSQGAPFPNQSRISHNIVGPCPTQEGPLFTHEVPLPTFTDSLSNQPGPSHTVVCPPTSQTSPSLIQSAPFTIHTDPLETQALSNIQQLDVLETQAGPSHVHEGPSHIQARPSHSKNIVGLQTTTVKCERCNRTFTRNKNLRQHMRTVHAEEPTFFVCDNCGKRYLWQNSLMKHIKTKHSDDKPGHHSCPKCGLKYTWESGLTRHMKHECGVPHQFTCSQCSYKTHYKSNLKWHMSKKHGSV